MRRLVENGQEALAKLVFVLLVLAVFGQIWFASTPLPYGGLNIIPAAAAGLFAVVLSLWRTAPLVRGAGVAHASRAVFQGRVRLAMPVLLALAMWAWVLSVYLRTGTFDSMRMGQLTVGIGVLFASLCVVTARRARALIVAIVVATSLSALFGIGVLVVGKPFVDAWLHIAQVAESDLETILMYGRTAGAAIHTATLGYQLVVAIVLAFAMLVLSAPAQRGRWGRPLDAVFFLLLTCMLASLVVNGSRSTMLGVGVGLGLCVVGVATARFPRRGVRRVLVVVPGATLVLLAFFNPWVNVGNIVEELRPVRLDEGLLELAVGGEELPSDNPDMLGHRFEGYKPGVEYDLRLRARYTKGFGSRTLLRARPDAEGDIVVTWRADPNRDVSSYQFRIAEATAPRIPPWKMFVPSLRSGAVKSPVRELTVGSAALTALTTGDNGIIGAELAGLAPAQEYDLQLRTSADSRPAQVRGHADKSGRLVLAWRRSVLPNSPYEYRLRRPPDEPWSAWRNCEPSLPRTPVWAELRAGSETLDAGASASFASRIGHEFAGFRPWEWYRVQVQETLVGGVARAPRHGEVMFGPRRTGYLVVTWPAPRAPEGVAGYRFRVRQVETDWLPWRPFTPSLSSKTPVPAALPTGWSVVQDDSVIRHTLLGLPAGIKQSVQLRMRAGAAFGRESIGVDGLVADDGSFVLAWRKPQEAGVAAVQFRRRSVVHERWLLWQNLAPPLDGGHTTVDLGAPGRLGDEAVNVAQAAQRVSGALRLQPRLLKADDLSARTRLPQTLMALRYAVANPFGTGVFRPSRAHAGEDVSDAMLEEMLRLWPHNQFLHVLVLYGFPGLCLHFAFYGFLAMAAWRAVKLAWREGLRAAEPRAAQLHAAKLRYLVVAVVAAWAAYSANSLLFPTGPFLQDWGHYFVLGLLLRLEGILAEERR